MILKTSKQPAGLHGGAECAIKRPTVQRCARMVVNEAAGASVAPNYCQNVCLK
jgi:hypothetical protein